MTIDPRLDSSRPTLGNPRSQFGFADTAAGEHPRACHGAAVWDFTSPLGGVAHISTTQGQAMMLGTSDLDWQVDADGALVGRSDRIVAEAAVTVRYEFTAEDRLRCSITFTGPGTASIDHVRFPLLPTVSGTDDHLVFPQWLGLLVPAEGPDLRVRRTLYLRPWCMAFTAATQVTDSGPFSYLATITDSLHRHVDIWRQGNRAGYELLGTPAFAERSGATRTQTVDIRFLEGDYVDVARAYRTEAMARSNWRTLATRTRPCSPKRLAGATFFAHVPCDYGTPVLSFDEVGTRAEALRENGLERVLLHIGGWNRLGYDNQYPDILPANPGCGGDDGMRRLTETLDRLGYVVAPHDDLGIISTEAPSYDEKWCARWTADGDPINGGVYREQQYYITTAAAHVHFGQRNMPEVAARFPKLRGYLFDVTTSVQPLEDHSESPPVTMAENLAGRVALFELTRRAFAEFVLGESIMEWALESLDGGFMAEEGYVHRGDGGWCTDELHGVIVPLWELVYHDAMLALRESTNHVNTDMDTDDPLARYVRIYLKTLRAGSLPPSFYSDDLTGSILRAYVDQSATDCGGWSGLTADQLLVATAHVSACLGDKVFLAPMTDHSFADGDLFRETTRFTGEDGETVVHINTDLEREWSPEPGLTLPPLGFCIRGPGLLSFHASQVAGTRFASPVLATLRSTSEGGCEIRRDFGPERVTVPFQGQPHAL